MASAYFEKTLLGSPSKRTLAKIGLLQILVQKSKSCPNATAVSKSGLMRLLLERLPNDLDSYVVRKSKDREEDTTLTALINASSRSWTIIDAAHWPEEVRILLNKRNVRSNDVLVENLVKHTRIILGSSRYYRDLIRKANRTLLDSVHLMLKKSWKIAVEPVSLQGSDRRIIFDVWAQLINLHVSALTCYTENRTVQSRLRRSAKWYIRQGLGLQNHGIWQYDGYGRGLAAKDTGLMAGNICLSKIEAAVSTKEQVFFTAQDFLRRSLKIEEENGNRKLFCPVNVEDRVHSKDTTLHATLCSGFGLVRMSQAMHNDSGLDDPYLKGIISYLNGLQKPDGGFSEGLDAKQGSSLNATSFVVSWLLDRTALGLPFQFVAKNFDLGGVLRYFHRQIGSIVDILNEGTYPHVSAACLNSLLLCGVYPYSSHVLDLLNAIVEVVKSKMEELEQIAPVTDRIYLEKLVRLLHTVRHSLNCLRIMKETRLNNYNSQIDILFRYGYVK